MNAVEIEEAISQLAGQPFDPDNFPYAFLEAFGNKETTIKRLRAGASNKSDIGGVLQTNNIHIATCDSGTVSKTLMALKQSPASARAKAKFILATDGVDFEAEDLASGETVACAYKDFPDHFGLFLPLADITIVRQIAENSFKYRELVVVTDVFEQRMADFGNFQCKHFVHFEIPATELEEYCQRNSSVVDINGNDLLRLLIFIHHEILTSNIRQKVSVRVLYLQFESDHMTGRIEPNFRLLLALFALE